MEKEKNLTQPEEKKSLFFKFIHGIEVVGNKLPQPFYLFSILIVVAIILSVIFAGATATYEKASSAGGAVEMVEVTIKNLLNKDTITYVTQNMYSIYYNFSPMMMMGLLMLSIGLCETTGFFGAFIKRTIGKAKPAVVFAVVAFVAINANTASNAGILGVTAVAGSVFGAMGYNPWLGILLAYAAGNAGMSANVFVGNLDVLISGINESVCAPLGIDISTVHVLQNWYFMGVCAIVLTAVFTWVTVKFVRPFIGEPKDLSLVLQDNATHELTAEERKGLRAAGLSAIIYLVVLVAICIPKNSFFRADNGSILPNSPLLKSVLTLLFLFFLVALLSTFLNLFMTSGSAKWMILAPILIPMLYTIGFSPALTTVAYRIGDSATNAIAPISSDVALIVGLLGKYNTDKSKTPGMGTVFANCMPYAIATFIAEMLILGVWWLLKLPLGPGVSMFVGG